MTREEATEKLKMILEEATEDENAVCYVTSCDADALDMAIKALEQTEPERKTGKWEYVQYDGNPKIGNWHCSNCRLIVNLGFEGKPYYHYCPGCGAEMEVEQ